MQKAEGKNICTRRKKKIKNPFCSPTSSEPGEAARARTGLRGNQTPWGIQSQGPFKEMKPTWEGWRVLPPPQGKGTGTGGHLAGPEHHFRLPVPARPSPPAPHEAKRGWSCWRLRPGNRAGGEIPQNLFVSFPPTSAAFTQQLPRPRGLSHPVTWASLF